VASTDPSVARRRLSALAPTSASDVRRTPTAHPQSRALPRPVQSDALRAGLRECRLPDLRFFSSVTGWFYSNGAPGRVLNLLRYALHYAQSPSESPDSTGGELIRTCGSRCRSHTRRKGSDTWKAVDLASGGAAPP